MNEETFKGRATPGRCLAPVETTTRRGGTLAACAAVGARSKVGLMPVVRSLGAVVLLSAVVLVLLAPEPARAHTITVGQSKIRQDGEVVHYDLAIDYDELAKMIGLGPLPVEASDAQRAETLRNVREELGAYLGSNVQVFLDGVGCEDSLELIEVVRHEGVPYAVMELAYQCPGSPSGSYEVHYDLLFGLVHPHKLTHWNSADYWLGGEEGSFVFSRGDQRLVVGATSPFPSAGRFAGLGFQHIFFRIEHVLFVIALLLGARSVRDGLKVVAAFTAAHTSTLVLASMGWLHVPQRIVEFLIPLSIGYVAIANIVWRESAHRLLAVFGFGLVHGLGFAGALNFTDHLGWSLFYSVLAFFVGIELGQASIILLVCPVLLLAHWLFGKLRAGDGVLESDTPGARRRTPRLPEWLRFAQLGASGLVAGAGLFLLIERLFLT